MKLTEHDVNFLRLVQRSKDTGEGWREVSVQLWRLVGGFPHTELIEAEPNGEGWGRVRLSPAGEIVVRYLT